MTESSPVLSGAETALWPTAAKKGDKRYSGGVEAAECFVARWHRDETERSWPRHGQDEPKSSGKMKIAGEGGRGGRVGGDRTDTTAEESRDERADRVTTR